MFTEVRYINNMDPVCCGRTFMTNASDLATLVTCQLGVMEEPKENADKVSWTAYGVPPRPLRWESRHKEDAESRRIQFNNVVIALTQVTSFICRGSTTGSATHL